MSLQRSTQHVCRSASASVRQAAHASRSTPSPVKAVRAFATTSKLAHVHAADASAAATKVLQPSRRPSLAKQGILSTVTTRRTMFIQTESTPNEDSLKFLPGQTVMESGTAEFLDTRSSMASPLAKNLFGIEGVKGVFYGPDFVTVSKDNEHQWSLLKPEIYANIMEFFSAGHALFPDPASHQGSTDTMILDTDSETVAMVKELLDTRVRPAIQEDGGDIEYRSFGEDTDGIVRRLAFSAH